MTLSAASMQRLYKLKKFSEIKISIFLLSIPFCNAAMQY